jgi:hypothetical protein
VSEATKVEDPAQPPIVVEKRVEVPVEVIKEIIVHVPAPAQAQMV